MRVAVQQRMRVPAQTQRTPTLVRPAGAVRRETSRQRTESCVVAHLNTTSRGLQGLQSQAVKAQSQGTRSHCGT